MKEHHEYCPYEDGFPCDCGAVGDKKMSDDKPASDDKPIDARLDVKERRILAQGNTPEEWAIEVSNVFDGFWTTTFYVGPQSFRLADGDMEEDNESEQHCMFIGKMFLAALTTFKSLAAGTLVPNESDLKKLLECEHPMSMTFWVGGGPSNEGVRRCALCGSMNSGGHGWARPHLVQQIASAVKGTP